MIIGVHKLNGRLMLVLDTERACQMTAEAASPG
jgi:chemotaxis signal transduction protein